LSRAETDTSNIVEEVIKDVVDGHEVNRALRHRMKNHNGHVIVLLGNMSNHHPSRDRLPFTMRLSAPRGMKGVGSTSLKAKGLERQEATRMRMLEEGWRCR
jgi:hypothetical protein